MVISPARMEISIELSCVDNNAIFTSQDWELDFHIYKNDDGWGIVYGIVLTTLYGNIGIDWDI